MPSPSTARAPALALAVLAAAPAALAQDRPLLVPTRDVSVTYRGAGGAAGHEMRMSWLVAEGKLRVDMPGGTGWALLDQRAGTMLMVMDQQRIVMEMPVRRGAGPFEMPTQPPASARFTRGAGATIAGTLCTTWRYEDGNARGETCVTADGVMLRSLGERDGRSAGLEAIAITYGPQDPARFQPPAGYQSRSLEPR